MKRDLFVIACVLSPQCAAATARCRGDAHLHRRDRDDGDFQSLRRQRLPDVQRLVPGAGLPRHL